LTGADTEIVVRRCRVEVIRSGGWSWGADQDRLARQVVAALPGLIEREFAGLWADGARDVEITEPVVLDLPVRLPDLLAGSVAALPAVAAAALASVRVEPALPPGPAGPDVAGPAAAYADPVPAEAAAVEAAAGALAPYPPAAGPAELIAGFLAELAVRDELGPLLELLPEPALRGLRARLRGAAPDDGGRAGLVRLFTRLAARGELADLVALVPAPVLDAWRQEWAAVRPGEPSAATRAAPGPAVADEGAAAVDPALRHGAGSVPGVAALRHQLDTVGRLRLVPGSAEADALLAVDWAGTAPDDAEPAPSATPVGRAPATGAVEVASVLPFLLVGPLARLGVLDALLPALAGASPDGLLATSQLVAAALGYTVLGPLGRGWRRSPADRVTAAAFAGLAEVPDDALHDVLRGTAAAAPVLDAVVALTLCRGHSPGRPLILAGAGEPAGSGLVLADAEGLFPIAWTDSAAALLPHWSACGRPLVLLAGAATALGPVPADALRHLTGAGVGLVTDLPPLRGERFRRLPGRRIWTSTVDTPDAELVPAVANLPDQAGRLDELFGALAVDRRATRLPPGAAWLRTLTLTAALALGTISWQLWRDREPADPLLALERLADLSGLVRYGADEVAVRIPLGRRHSDLRQHGLLATVRDVPWLGGRALTITGG